MCGVSLVNWLGKRDPGFAATRRATRTALVMPALFAIGAKVIANPALATFAAFGTFAQLTLVDFQGTIRERVESQLTLAAAGAAAVCLGTLVSRSTVLAAIAMAVVGFAVLFSGAISSVLAAATTSLLLAFILPVAIPAPISQIPDRLMGWGLAAAASLVAIVVLWPAPARNPLRTAAIAATRALAVRLRTSAAYVLGTGTEADHEGAVESSDAALAQLERVFLATPYRPTGLSTAARTVVRLVDELRWLNEIVARSAPRRHPPGIDTHVCAVKSAVATLLERAADELDEPARAPAHWRRRRRTCARGSTSSRRARRCGCPARTARERRRRGRDRDRARPELPRAGAQLRRRSGGRERGIRRRGRPAQLARPRAGPPARRAPEHALGRAGAAGSYLERHSVWLQNSVRGAAGLGLAVLVAKLAGVQHAFWVVLAALSVLRSNALNTGGSVLRGLIGPRWGSSSAVARAARRHQHDAALVPAAARRPARRPRAGCDLLRGGAGRLHAGGPDSVQHPPARRAGRSAWCGSRTSALGGAVSLAVGLLFWPRGAGGRSAGPWPSAYADSASYLARAVQFGGGTLRRQPVASRPPTMEAANAAAAARRLDDAFRGFLAERGSKPIPLAEVTSLVSGVAGLRLTGDAVLELWRAAGARRRRPRRGAARAARGRRADDRLVRRLRREPGRRRPRAGSLDSDGPADSRLVEAVSHDLRSRDGDATGTGVRVIWTGDHLDAARRLQGCSSGRPARPWPARGALDRRLLGRRGGPRPRPRRPDGAVSVSTS